MTENNIHRLGNKTFRLWYDISLLRNDSRARIAVCPALFPTLFTAFMPKISPLVSLEGEILGIWQWTGWKYSWTDCNSCSGNISNQWDIVPDSQFYYLIYETYISTLHSTQHRKIFMRKNLYINHFPPLTSIMKRCAY